MDLNVNIKWVPKKDINFSDIKLILNKSINSGHLTNYGPGVRELEAKLEKLLQIDHNRAVILVNSGTSALHGIIGGLKIFSKDVEWNTQAFTFSSSAQGPLKSANILDIDENGGLDLNKIVNSSNKIPGIIVTNLFGYLVDINNYVKWKKENKGFLIFDNAATPYSFYNNKNSLNYGDASIISFHHTKPLGFGEGGAIVIKKKYEDAVRRCINFGFNDNRLWHPEGSNYKISDISAAFIASYLNNFETIVKIHRNLYIKFKRKLEMKNLNCSLLNTYSSEIPFVACFFIVFPNNLSGKIIDAMNKYIDIVEIKKYYRPLVSLEQSESLFNNSLCFPCHKDLTEKDLEMYIYIIEEIFD